MNLVQTYLSAYKDRQSNFNYSGGNAISVLTCFRAEMVGESSFECGGSTVGLVQPFSRAGKVLENSFDHSGGQTKLMQACLSTRKGLENCFQVLWTSCRHVKGRTTLNHKSPSHVDKSKCHMKVPPDHYKGPQAT